MLILRVEDRTGYRFHVRHFLMGFNIDSQTSTSHGSTNRRVPGPGEAEMPRRLCQRLSGQQRLAVSLHMEVDIAGLPIQMPRQHAPQKATPLHKP